MTIYQYEVTLKQSGDESVIKKVKTEGRYCYEAIKKAKEFVGNPDSWNSIECKLLRAD